MAHKLFCFALFFHLALAFSQNSCSAGYSSNNNAYCSKILFPTSSPSTDDYGYDVKYDYSGNTYVVAKAVSFAKLTKFDEAKNVVWSVSSTSNAIATSVVVDPQAQFVYFGGKCNIGATITFSNGASGSCGFFVMKLFASNGTLVWLDSSSGGAASIGYVSLLFDNSATMLYLAMPLYGAATVGGTAISAGSAMLVAKMSLNKVMIQYATFGGSVGTSSSLSEFKEGIQMVLVQNNTASSDGLYFTTCATGVVTFGSISINANKGSTDSIIGKLNSTTLDAVWVTTFGTSSDDYGTGTIQVPPLSLNNTGTTVKGYFTVLDAVLGQAMTLVLLSGTTYGVPTTIIYDKTEDRVYATGMYAGTLNFGTITYSSVSGSVDMYIFQLDPSNYAVLWSRSIGAFLHQDRVFGLGISNRGALSLVGVAQGTIVVDSQSVTCAPNYCSIVISFEPSCTPCSAGYFSPTIGGTCAACPESTFSQPSATSCSPCPGGMYAPAGSSNSSCVTNSCPSGRSVQPSFNQIITAGSVSNDEGTCIAIDSIGNRIMVGKVSGPLLFASTSYPYSSRTDSFIAKYDASGSLMFLNSITGNKNEIVTGVGTDSSGNIYVAGYLHDPNAGASQFDVSVNGVAAIANCLGYPYASFAAKFSPSGSLIHVISEVASSSLFFFNMALGIHVKSNGEYFIYGSAASAVTLSGSTVIFNGGYRAYVYKQFSNGTLNWRGLYSGSSQITKISAACTDSQGFLYIGGTYATPFTIGTTTLNTGSLFVAKLHENNGTVVWVKSFGTSTSDEITNMLFYANSLFVTGSLNGNQVIDGISLIVSGASDILFLRFSTTGTLLAGKCYGGTDNDKGMQVAVDAVGNLHLAGYFASGSVLFDNIQVSSKGANDMFIVQMGASYNTTYFASSIGGTGSDIISSIAFDSQSYMHFTGHFTNTVSFNEVAFSAIGNTDIVMGKYITSCASCIKGTYSNAVNVIGTCTACPAGKYNNIVGAKFASDCASCIPGFYSSAGSSSCLACPIGTSAPNSDSSSCTPCAAGTITATIGSSTCQLCFAGSYNDKLGWTNCTLCPEGTFNNLPGGSSNASCLACPAGTFAASPGSSSCQLCTAGTFNNVSRSTQCSPCDQGSYSTKIGAASYTDCLPCAIGTFSSALAANSEKYCLKCPAGTYQSLPGATAQSSCVPCPVGYYSSIQAATNATQCLPCPLGSFSTAPGASSCQICAPGTYSATLASQSCTFCPTGYYSATPNATNIAQCIPCPSGSFSNQIGATSCQNCTSGTFASSQASLSCQLCPIGTYATSSSSSSCTPCASGFYSSVVGAQTNICSPCVSGTFSTLPGSSSCSPCQAGYFASGSSNTICQPCASGYFASSAASTSCLACNIGTYASQLSASTSCLPCPIGTYSISSAASSVSSCIPCPNGTFSSTLGASSLASCQACQPGTFSSTTGATSCQSCAIGTASNSFGATTCLPCAKGTYSPSSGSLVCTLCAAGYYNDETASSQCIPCHAGKFSSAPGATNASFCALCTPGSSSTQGSAVCSPCPTSYYSDLYGSTNCTACPKFTFSPVGSSSVAACLSCSAGTFLSIDGSACVPCAQGTYSAIIGATTASACQSCPFAKVSQAGATSCSFCPIGFIPRNLSTCEACTEGKSSQQGDISCSVCKAGFYVHVSQGCIPCASGNFSDEDGAASCKLCNPGFYSLEGQSSCKSCPPGFFANSAGSKNCIPCAQTFYTPVEASTFCSPCNSSVICPIGAKAPLSKLLTESVPDIGDPYFNRQKSVNEKVDGANSGRVAVIVTAILVVILIAFVTLVLLCIAIYYKARTITKMLGFLELIDSFSLKHYVKPKASPVNTSTSLGGFFTVLLLILVIAILIISIIDISVYGNITESTSVVPREVVSIDRIYGHYELTVYLYNYIDSNCTAITTMTGLAGEFNATKSTLHANGTCVVQISCKYKNCSLFGTLQEIAISFPHEFAMAKTIDYYMTLPYFDDFNASHTIFARYSTRSATELLKGQTPTQIVMSFTTTSFVALNPADYFFYGIGSKLFGSWNTRQFYGYSVTHFPVIQGSAVNQDNIWIEKNGLNVLFSFQTNPNAYLIQQQGRNTILDFFSKIFALIAAAAGLLAAILGLIENVALRIQEKRAASKAQSKDTEMKPQNETQVAK